MSESTETLDNLAAGRSASDAHIRTFYDHSSECYAILVATGDGSFRYEDLNPATLRLYGVGREQVIGYTIEEVLGPGPAAEISAHMTACLRSGAPYRYERVQGRSVVEALATPVSDPNGTLNRVVVSARDVSERRRLEEQLRQSQKMEAVGQLTGGIAHDFNNLLTVILGNLDALRRRFDSGEQPSGQEYHRLSGAAVRAAERAASLTHRLLAFSRQQPLAPENLDLNKLIAGMSEMLRRTLGENIAIEAVLAGGLWRCRADPNQLESAILNLAINARDAMPTGGKLTIETENAHLSDAYAAEHLGVGAGQYVMLAVSDVGSGMPPDIVEKAFEPFFTTKKVGYGTGLGLSMVYGFVRQSGGHVKIYSEVGQGTAVKLYLPRLMAAETAAAAEATPPAPSWQGGAVRRDELVLIVEDDELVRDYSLQLFRELGFDPLEAGDAAGALRILESRPNVELLFTDIVLPGGINGRQLADEARKRCPGIKVLFTTGYTRNAIIHNGMLDPGVELVTKPFTMDVLARKVAEMLPAR